MLILEFKLIRSKEQADAIGESLRIGQFIRNKALRLWMDDMSLPAYALNKYCAILARDYAFCDVLNSQARQAAAERAAYAIQRYQKPDKSGKRLDMPSFQKDNRSIEYKITGWKLSPDRKSLTITDRTGIGTMKMFGQKDFTRDLCAYDLALFKRVRILRRADGDYVQFCIAAQRSETQAPTGTTVGIDVGLLHFYSDSNGNAIDCPKFLRKAEKKIKREQRRLSRKVKGSANRRKARKILAKRHFSGDRRSSNTEHGQKSLSCQKHLRCRLGPVWPLACTLRKSLW